MTGVLRLYEPDECEEITERQRRGPRPLDWRRCRTCKGKGHGYEGCYSPLDPCATCGGHGSLKAAALAWLMSGGAKNENHPLLNTGSPPTPRCEGCGHPMSEPTWSGPAAEVIGDGLGQVSAARMEKGWIRREADPTYPRYSATPWTPCDEGCRHEGPGRVKLGEGWVLADRLVRASNGGLNYVINGTPVEASWRRVDVRTLGWRFDLRPESLAVLCSRCFVARVPPTA